VCSAYLDPVAGDGSDLSGGTQAAQTTDQMTNQTTNQTTDQPNDRPTKRPANQTTGQPNDRPTKRPANQTTDQPNNRPNDRPITSTYQSQHWKDEPAPAAYPPPYSGPSPNYGTFTVSLIGSTVYAGLFWPDRSGN
jgi:hypothetical protein